MKFSGPFLLPIPQTNIAFPVIVEES